MNEIRWQGPDGEWEKQPEIEPVDWALVLHRAFIGVGGLLIIAVAAWGMDETVDNFLRLALAFLGFGLFVGAFRPPRKEEG